MRREAETVRLEQPRPRLVPPPIPRPENRVENIEQIAQDLALDDQINALRGDDDELAAQIAEVRRAGENTAHAIELHLDRIKSDVRIAHSLATEARRDVRALKATSDAHAATLEQHRLGLVDHGAHILDIREKLDALHQEVDDNYLLAASHDRLEALQARLDKLEVREAGNYCLHGSYGALAREVATLKLQLIQQQSAGATALAPRVSETRPSRIPLWVFYGSIATAAVIALAYVISTLG
jgi:DNA repair exonuclease SbcCD ATPase subunit